MREDARPRWGPWGPEGTGRSEARGLPAGWGSVQVQAQQAAGHQICNLRGPVPAGPWPWRRQRSQVQLMGLDVLELFPKLQKRGPCGSIQVPAVLHHLVDCGRAAIRSVHLIALFHPRDDVLQGNSWVRHSPEGIDFPEKDSETPHIRLGGKFLLSRLQALSI